MNKIDINLGGYVIEEIILKLNLRKYLEKIILDMIKKINYEFIFDIPWLKKYNLVINWK